MVTTDSANLEHPSPNELLALFRGRLERSHRAAVETHVLDCEECCARLDDLSQPDEDEQNEMLCLARESASSAWLDATRRASSGQSDDDIREPAATADDEWRHQIRLLLSDHPRYEIREELESGGMGVVFTAKHRMMRRTVVIKVVNRRLMLNQSAAARFRRETLAAARLSHPSIVTAYDSEEYRGLHFLVMEYVKGTTLVSLVREHGPLDPGTACEYVRQAAEGLQHAFERRMIHRDIKPQNLMLTPEGTIKILDFGLARFVRDESAEMGDAGRDSVDFDDSVDLDDEGLSSAQMADEAMSEPQRTRAGTLMGTPGYAAPEQFGGSGDADIRADIYGLGGVLHFLLTGQPPRSPEAFEQTLADEDSRASTQVEPMSRMLSLENLATSADNEHWNTLPRDVTTVLKRMLAPNPDDRFETPADVVSALDEVVRPEAPLAKQRKAGPAVVVGMFVALGCLALGYEWFVRDRSESPASQSEADMPAAAPVGPVGPVEEELTVAFWNVEKLYDTVNDSDDEKQSPFSSTLKGRWTDEKLDIKLTNLARVISDMPGDRGPDILALGEVENANVLSLLIEHLEPLRRDYGIVHQNSPYWSGLECGLIYDRDVFELTDQRFHRIEGVEVQDILEATLTRDGASLAVLVGHWPIEEHGIESWLTVARVVRRRIDELLERDPAADLMLIGDLKDAPGGEVLSGVLQASVSSDDLPSGALFNSSWEHFLTNRGTFVLNNEWKTRDYILLSAGLLDSTRFEWVPGSTDVVQHPYQMFVPEDPNGIPVPAGSFPERHVFNPNGYSDHLPVACRLRLNSPAR